MADPTFKSFLFLISILPRIAFPLPPFYYHVALQYNRALLIWSCTVFRIVDHLTKNNLKVFLKLVQDSPL